MQKWRQSWCGVGIVVALGATVLIGAWDASAADKPAAQKTAAQKADAKKAAAKNAGEKKPKQRRDAALERTRDTVKMLDDVYKTAVVLITDKYVNDEDDFPAGGAAVALFDAIKKKGWHEVRLLDATGEPYDDDNVARDDFDRAAIKALKAGESWYEQVEKRDGKRVLRAATPIPVVMKKCVMCHPHYEKAKPNEPVGLLSYTIEVK